MEIVFGGAYQGKLEYAKEKLGLTEYETCSRERPELDFSKRGIYKLEEFTLACVKQHVDGMEYLKSNQEKLQEKVVICTDISQGIVPMDPQQRAWREMTGRVLVYLCREADRVTRVFCGLGQEVK